jgi:hypothetical protein
MRVPSQLATLCMTVLAIASANWSSAQSSRYAVLEPDVRVAVDAKELASIVASAHLFSWGGIFDTGWQICSSPDVHLELQNPSLLLRGWNSLVDGNGVVAFRLMGNPKIFTNDSGCGSLGLTGRCAVDGCSADVVPGFGALNAKCTLFGVQVVNDLLAFPSPIVVASSVPFELPRESQKNESGETSLEFGSYENRTWKPAADRFVRNIPLRATPRGFGGSPLIPCSANQEEPVCDKQICGVPYGESSSLMRRNVDRIAIDVALPPPTYSVWNSETEAEAGLSASDPIKAGDLAGLAFSKRALQGDSNGSGLLQRVLPIRIFGYQMAGSVKVNFELILVEASAAVGSWNSSEAILVSFGVAGAKAWLDSAPAVRVDLRKVGVEGVIGLPTFRPGQKPGTADVVLDVRQFRVGFATVIGNLKVCCESIDLQKPLESFVGSLARYIGPGPLLPDCIQTGDQRLRAARDCAGKRKGWLSAERPDKNPTIALDFARASSRIDKDGNLLISVPRVR